MAFDLKLISTGMILYVPEDTRLHMLMPRTTETMPAPVLNPDGTTGCCADDESGCVEPHAARMTFDTAYLRQGSQTPDNVRAHVSLRQKRLDLPAFGSAYVSGIPAEVAAAPAPVRQDVIDGESDEDLAARITVSSGQATWCDPGECWDYDGGVRRMSHQVEWTISGIDADALQLELTDLAGTATQGTLPTLYPIDGTIELWIWHAPAWELPPDAIMPELPADGSLGHHFGHMAVLLDTAATLTLPVFRPNQCPEVPATAWNRNRDKDKGGASLACTGMQGTGGGTGGSGGGQ